MCKYLLCLWLACVTLPCATAAPSALTAPAPAAATLQFANRDIVTFRASLGGVTPQLRVSRTEASLDALSERALSAPLTRLQLSMNGAPVTVFQLGDRLLFWLVPDDRDPASAQSYPQLVERTDANLRAALVAKADGLHWPNLIHGAITSAIATALLIVASWLLGRLRRKLLAVLARVRDAHTAVAGFDWIEMLQQWAVRLIQTLAVLAWLALAWAWLLYVLEQFTFTQPLGDRMGALLAGLASRFAQAFIDAIPGVMTVVVILLITRAVNALVIRIFASIQQGQMEIPGLHPETAGATRRMVSVLVWALGLTFAYPYIPGSQSDVFKGLSVLFGFMITLGSAGVVNQLMSGMVLVYSRALRRGDLVAIGDTTGVVTELSTLSVKLLTRRMEEITIPNAVVVGNTIYNYTRQAGPAGSLVSTTVTIGYDTPWRQVHAMLIGAALRTPGLAQTPTPYVLQRALSDFYVEYQLFAHMPNPLERASVLSVLHGEIQDEFNTHGVQIMSPHFEEQPERNVLVPRAAWYTAPAVPPAGPQPASPKAP
ncbi:mechanosensitive ion channel family protein [Amantichitinum ursilacus]|uniref:Small-conductance mechanosensitive channel n=1 Tax=Amantichitinum ursilacus TaxID=857265 RepID=A0A0N0XG93_9NEIS|nr:mechanosensitive ion channel domain-containing protein [Amantichitinum ursilacus]KPC49880.1 putative MscS family protein.1 precursor [Amantichitinum ursilacus]